jgi:starch phosphorylase
LKEPQISDKKLTLEQKWNSIHFGEVKYETFENQHHFTIEAYFNELDPGTVQVELFANGIKGDSPTVLKMTQGAKLDDSASGYQYTASVDDSRPASDYTARVIPSIPNISVPLEISRILWQH